MLDNFPKNLQSQKPTCAQKNTAGANFLYFNGLYPKDNYITNVIKKACNKLNLG